MGKTICVGFAENTLTVKDLEKLEDLSYKPYVLERILFQTPLMLLEILTLFNIMSNIFVQFSISFNKINLKYFLMCQITHYM